MDFKKQWKFDTYIFIAMDRLIQLKTVCTALQFLSYVSNVFYGIEQGSPLFIRSRFRVQRTES